MIRLILIISASAVLAQNPFPPPMTVVDMYVGPQSNPNNPDTMFEVCVPQMLLLSDYRKQVGLWVNTSHPELTVKYIYTGVNEATENIYRTELCNDLIGAYSLAMPALVDQDLVIPLDSYTTKFSIINGFNPFTDVIPQSSYDARITKRGDTGPRWYFSIDRVQILAMAGNITTIQALGEKIPPPYNGSYGWATPLSNSWTWPTAVRYINRMFDELKIEEPYQNEVCEFATTMEAIALSVGTYLINTDGSCGLDDPKFEAAVENILLPIIEGKPHQNARWMYMNSTEIQRFMMDPPEDHPPSRSLNIPIGTCLISDQVQGLAVLSRGPATLQRFRSPGPTNTMQTWGWGISARSKNPDRVWDFIAFTINCNNPVWKEFMLTSGKIPNFKHCLDMQEFKDAIDSSPSMQNSLAERDKSFPLTYPGPPPAHTHMIETQSLHLRFLGRLIQGAMPDINWTNWRVPPYSEIPSRWGMAVRHPLPPGYNRNKVAKSAIKEACAVLKFIQLPTCSDRNVQYAIAYCDITTAYAKAQWNPLHMNITCLGTGFANWTLDKMPIVVTECPYYTAVTSIGKAAIIAPAIVSLLVIAMVIVMIKNWHAFILRVSSRVMTLIYLVGIFILAWTPALFLISCSASVAALTNGLFLAVGAMWAKLYRLVRMLVAGNRFKSVKIPDRKLLIIIGIIELINNLIFVVWYITRGDDLIPTPVQQTNNQYEILPVMQCNMGSWGAYVAWITFLIILLGTAAYMAWRMSKYSGSEELVKAAQDSKALLAISFTMIVFVASATFTLSAATTWKSIVITQLGMVTSICFLMVLIYFIPRLYQLKYDPNASKNGTMGPADTDPDSEKKRKLDRFREHAHFQGSSNVEIIIKTNGSTGSVNGAVLSSPKATQPDSTTGMSRISGLTEAWTDKNKNKRASGPQEEWVLRETKRSDLEDGKSTIAAHSVARVDPPPE